jgi:hypothetical protein
VANAVAATGTTSSTTYTDLASTEKGPSVELTVPASGRVLVSVTAGMVGSTGSTSCFMGFEVLPGPTPASDANALILAGNATQKASASFVVNGLTAGAHTFEAKYRAASAQSTCTFFNRSIFAIPLP